MDPTELKDLLWQLVTHRTGLTKQPRTWTIREQRAALRSFNQRISAVRDTPLWVRPDFQAELRPLRDAATGHITAIALQYAFADLKAFADKWYSSINREIDRKLNANTASVLMMKSKSK